MPASSVAELQQKLYKRIGVGPANDNGPDRQNHARRPGRAPPTRREQRKSLRTYKKSNIYTAKDRQSSSQPIQKGNSQLHNATDSKPSQAKSSLKKPRIDEHSVSGSDGDEEDPFRGGEMTDDDEGEVDNEPDSADDDEADHHVSRTTKERLAQDDAEIEALERKLGIKKGRKSLPQSFKEDGLQELLGDSGAESDGTEDESSKRKRDYDDWLNTKRRKTNLSSSHRTPSLEEDDSDLSGVVNDDDFGFSDEDEEDNLGEGSEDDIATSRIPSKGRENPYVAPVTGNVVAKYVPPSLRKSSGTETEASARLRKQIQGLINRLTDANLLSIVQSVEELYQSNARGDVTNLLTDTILAQVHKPETLPDQFFVLTGGFSAAIYMVVGSSFGSHFIRRVVEDLGKEYDVISALPADESTAIPKQASNLLTLLSQLYVFEVVSCKIVFDYMERLLSELNEVNVELLLRICRMGGGLLRRDDPHALKHVSSVLSKAVARVGYDNVSARTKFMIETIDNLKEKKAKGRGLDSVVTSEHVQRMRKHLGELKAQSSKRRLEGLAPMGMDLADVEGADSLGKWWLVGASVPVKTRGTAKESKGTGADKDRDQDNHIEDMDIILPDFTKKARAQNLSTPTQIAIFTALMTATNYEQGHMNVLKLRLKKDDALELARVLVQCVGSEMEYNGYYALVAREACVSNPKIKFALQTRLWQVFRGLGESLFGEEDDADGEQTADSERFQDEDRTKYVAFFYASLIAQGTLKLTILKPLEISQAGRRARALLEWLFLDLLEECRSRKEATEDAKVDKVFGVARELPSLAAGVHWLLREKIDKTKKIGGKTAKRLERVRGKAKQAVRMEVM